MQKKKPSVGELPFCIKVYEYVK